MSRASPHAPPKLIVSRPAEEVVASTATPRPTLASRRRSKTESSALKGRSDAIEWIDVDEHEQPRRRRRSSAKRSMKHESSRSRSNTESEVSRFFPSLTRILESSNESRPASRPGPSGSDSRKQREGSSVTHRRRHRDDISTGYRRPVKHRTGGVSRRQEPAFKFNPSLLSVLTSLTGTSDSSSSTTITQRSYDRRSGDNDTEGRRKPESEKSTVKKPSSSNVFDYMEAPSVDDGHDGVSLYSSSSSSAYSHYEHSDAGSSILPETPSSHSTAPSPTATRNPSLTGSVAELRRKYDPQYASPAGSQRSYSPESSTRSLKKLAKVEDVPEVQDEAASGAEATQDDKKRSSSVSSRSSRASHRDEDRLRNHEEAMRQHQARSQHGRHLVEPVYGQHRSHSASSTGSTGSARAYAQYMAMQRYQYPSPPVPMAYPIPPQATNGHVAHPDRPPVPDAPDLSQRTLAGYEQLAVELSNKESPVKPIYRKFEHLNHRILLHLQDELSEMEEQLRTLDEIIAQMEPPGQQRPPASRRGDMFGGSEIHAQRTLLLGRIFQKTEQYNRALSSFQSMTRDVQSADAEQVSTYREYLKAKNLIHEVETRFLQEQNMSDLISLQRMQNDPVEERAEPITTRQAVLTCLPVALMLPLLLFVLIPNLAGRLLVTILVAMGAGMVAATTRVWECMEPREWAVCGAGYVLVMAAVAGCVPVH